MSNFLPVVLLLLFGGLAIWINRRFGTIVPPRILVGILAGAYALRQLIRAVQNGSENWHVALSGAITLLFVADVIRGVIKRTRTRNNAA